MCRARGLPATARRWPPDLQPGRARSAGDRPAQPAGGVAAAPPCAAGGVPPAAGAVGVGAGAGVGAGVVGCGVGVGVGAGAEGGALAGGAVVPPPAGVTGWLGGAGTSPPSAGADGATIADGAGAVVVVCSLSGGSGGSPWRMRSRRLRSSTIVFAPVMKSCQIIAGNVPPS